MPFNASLNAQRDAIPNPEILATPLDTSVIENIVLAASATTADSSGVYTGRRYLLAGTVLAKRDDGLYIPFVHNGGTQSEVQKLVLEHATGGTFKLAFKGQETAAIAFNATTTVVKEKLEGLSTIGSGNVSVTGTAGAFYTITFAGTLASTDEPVITVDGSALTGTSPTATVETVTEGAEKIAGVLFNTVEFADATTASNEPAAMLRRNVSFKKQAIVNFSELETELVAWGKESLVLCEFVSVTNAQES